jgi:hypothetical protein
MLRAVGQVGSFAGPSPQRGAARPAAATKGLQGAHTASFFVSAALSHQSSDPRRRTKRPSPKASDVGRIAMAIRNPWRSRGKKKSLSLRRERLK